MKFQISKINYYDQLIEFLFKGSSTAVWATNIIAPIGIVYILIEFIDELYLYTFLIMQILLGLARVFIAKKGLHYLNVKNKKKILKYLKFNLLLIFTNSTLYGTMSAFAVYQADELQVFIVLALLFGLASGSFATLSSVFHALLFYILPFSLIFTIALFSTGDDVYFLIGSMILIYLLVTLPSSFRIFMTFITNIEKNHVILEQKEEILKN